VSNKQIPSSSVKTSTGRWVSVGMTSDGSSTTRLGDMTLDKSRAAKIALNLQRLHLLRSDQSPEPQ
jgi:hypothetical protein